MKRCLYFCPNHLPKPEFHRPRYQVKRALRHQLLYFALVVGCLLSGSGFAATNVEISVSPFFDRSGSLSLEGRMVNGKFYIFVPRPKKTKWRGVKFFLDDLDRTKARYRSGRRFPYNFVGGNKRRAKAFDTSSLSNGEHTITAVLKGRRYKGRRYKGRRYTEIIKANFTVDNQANGYGLPSSSETAELAVSSSSDRSGSLSLKGRTVNGKIYIFVPYPRGVKWRAVKFFLDDPDRTKARYSSDRRFPYDFVGGNKPWAKAFDTSSLSNGKHTITAVLKGRRYTEIINANFTVDNQVNGFGQLASSVETLNFGEQLVGTTSAAKTVKFTNSGTASVNISTVTTTGNFQLVSNGCGTLSIGQSCDVSVDFKPTAAGMQNGTVTVTSDAGITSLNIPLTGVGAIGVLSPSATSVDFGGQIVGDTTSTIQSVTITNTGTAPVNVQNVSVNGDFQWVSNTCGIVIVGESCSISLKFSPSTLGTHNNTLKISSDAENDTLAIPLTGVGLIAELDVTLTWDPNPDSVTNYNIYYGDTPNIVDTLLVNIPIMDIDPQAPSYQVTVDRDATLCFGVKASNDDGLSELSNVVCWN